jgi:5'-nucleotidase
MSASGPGRRRIVAAVAAAATLALVAALPAQASNAAGHKPAAPGKTTMDIQMLSFNDFHGNLEPPTGSSGRLITGYTETQVVDANGQPVFNPDGSPKLQATAVNQDVGGVAYLATKLRNLRAGHAHSITVAAGDLIGASPLVSAAFHDEPTIQAMNELGLEVTSVGNHEFDEGYQELLRMQNGGCIDDGPDGLNNQNSCPDGSFAGANFQYLSANVKYEGTDQTILPPYWIKNFNGAKIGFIGMTLKETPSIVTAAGVAGLEFTDEVATANALVPVLEAQGVKAIVVLVHQGAIPASTTFTGASGKVYTVASPYDATCAKGGTLSASDSAIVPIAENLDPQIDMIVSGHTHTPYVCDIPDPDRNSRMVTSASSFGRLVTETNMTFDRRTQDIVRTSVKSANMLVDRNHTPAPDLTALVNHYNVLIAPIKARPIGSITADVTKNPNAAGESNLGDLIADAQVNDPSTVVNGVKPVVAFMNPGGIRADLVYAASASGEAPGVITFGEAFAVQPFGNLDTSMDMTGAQIYTLLEQQWPNADVTAGVRVLQVSNGFSYRWNPAAGVGHRVIQGSVKINDTVVANDASQTFRVVANNFLAGGGDSFPIFNSATNKVIGGQDIDAFANYLPTVSPYTPGPLTRITTGPS